MSVNRYLPPATRNRSLPMHKEAGDGGRWIHSLSAAELRQWMEDVQPTGDFGRFAKRLLRKAEARERSGR